MPFTTKDTFTFDHTVQPDYPNWIPSVTKTNMNARGEELRLALNAVVNLLNATGAGVSGANSIGATAPTGLVGATSQALFNDLVSKVLLMANTTVYVPATQYNPATKGYVDSVISGIVVGQVPDGSLGDVKLATDVKVGSLALLTTTDKTNVTNAVNELNTNAISHLADYMPHQSGLNSYATAVDTNEIYTILNLKRSDATLYMKSTLSGGTSPSYTTDTWQFYDALGTTVVLTKTWTISYDAGGKITSKVVV